MKKNRKREELQFFPAVEELKDFVSAVAFEFLAPFFVGDDFLLELADVVGFFGKEDDAVDAGSGCAHCNSHDLPVRRYGFPSFVGSANVEVHEHRLLEKALVAACDGFPVPRGRVSLAEHGYDEVVSVLCHGFEVVAKPHLTQQRVREAVYEERLILDDVSDFAEEFGDGFCSPLYPTEAALAPFFDASWAGAEVAFGEVLAADADARRLFGGVGDDFEVVLSRLWVGHANDVPAQAVILVRAQGWSVGACGNPVWALCSHIIVAEDGDVSVHLGVGFANDS